MKYRVCGYGLINKAQKDIKQMEMIKGNKHGNKKNSFCMKRN